MIIGYKNFGRYDYLYIPANLPKGTRSRTTIFLTNTATKETKSVEFQDMDHSNPRYYKYEVWASSSPFSLIPGEYEYEIEGNRGLLRVVDAQAPEKKEYYTTDTFKYYES